jgi:hypothetical protein
MKPLKKETDVFAFAAVPSVIERGLAHFVLISDALLGFHQDSV